MKKLRKRLQLNRETLLRLAKLTPDEAEKVAGGVLCSRCATTCATCVRCNTRHGCSG